MGNLNAVSQTASANGYLFALHENYVDFYPDATNSPGYEWNPSDVALYTNGTWELSWSNETAQIQSYLMKPTRASKYLTNFASQIHSDYGTTASFLDAHSSLNPSARVDYDSTTPNPGRFLETLSSWRSLYGLLRTYHDGPVSGEGDNHGCCNASDTLMTWKPRLTAEASAIRITRQRNGCRCWWISTSCSSII